jgi:hypothetical protein
LFDRSQHQHYDRGDDRERLASARQAAEALFTPKRKIAEQSMREGAAPAAESVRKPRILAILPAAPVCHEEPEAPISPKQQMTSEIARSQFARIRTWVRYGMTAHQVAEVYGVAVGEIERILRKA